jgi:hypothetical protein
MPISFKFNKTTVFNFILIVLAVIGMTGFWLTETSQIFRWGIFALLIFSLWRVYLKDTSPILFVVGFINTTLLFSLDLFQNKSLNSFLSVLGIFIMMIFLFNYHHLKSKLENKSFLSVYSSLLGLMVGELFFVLTFFPIEAKNKAILIVLFLWIYDEFVVGFEAKTLSFGFTLLMSAIFILIFVSLALTFPFNLGS